MSYNFDKIEYLKNNIKNIQKFIKTNNFSQNEIKEKVYSQFNDFVKNIHLLLIKLLIMIYL